MEIQRVVVDDTKELLDIYSHYVLNTAISFEYEAPSFEEFKNRIINISAKYPYIKAVIDGKIVGYAYANTFKDRKAYDYSVETTIYIHKDYKNKGIGKALYLTLENSLKDMGITNMNACITMPKDEPKDSYNFHLKLGYTLVGTFHNSGYKFNKWYDMIWMEKIISNYTDSMNPVKFGNWKI